MDFNSWFIFLAYVFFNFLCGSCARLIWLPINFWCACSTYRCRMISYRIVAQSWTKWFP